MKRVALMKDGRVVNIALWDGIKTWNPGEDYQLVDVTENPEVVVEIPVGVYEGCADCADKIVEENLQEEVPK